MAVSGSPWWEDVDRPPVAKDGNGIGIPERGPRAVVGTSVSPSRIRGTDLTTTIAASGGLMTMMVTGALRVLKHY